MVFLGFPLCIPLVYSLGASCSFLIYILLFTDKKKKKKRNSHSLKASRIWERKEEKKYLLLFCHLIKRSCETRVYQILYLEKSSFFTLF